jgi:16S rRNA processing protein RimM
VGAVLEIPVEQLPSIDDPDEFYVRDLIGCSVVLSPSGRALGTVVQVHEGAANDSLSVRAEDGTVVLVPFTHDAIVGFELQLRRMAVREDLFGGVDA